MFLTLIDQRGWEKQVQFSRGIIRIGSAAGNEVQIDDPAVAPIHLQVQQLPGAFAGQALNLGHDLTLLRGTEEITLPQYTSAALAHGDEIVLGKIRLRFQFPPAQRVVQQAASFRAEFSLPSLRLSADVALEGWLRLQNTGEVSPCQFQVHVHGLDEACVHVDPIPLLHTNAQEEVRVRFSHCGATPPAGRQRITLVIAAPTQYPAQQVVIEQEIFVQPVFAYRLQLEDDLQTTASESRFEAQTSEPFFTASEVAPQRTTPPVPAAVSTPQAAVSEQPQKAVRRIHASALPDDFWDEEP